MTEGWIGGMVLEAALKSAGWPADAAKIRAAMENVKVDTQGPARRADRVEQGQSLPHPPVLSRLSLGSGEVGGRGGEGLGAYDVK